MKTTYVFFADGFEEIEALSAVDVMRRAGMPVVTVSINETNQVQGAHGVNIVADSVFAQNDYSETEWLVLPGGMPGATNLVGYQPLASLLKQTYAAGGKIAAICASPAVVLGSLGIVAGHKAVCYPGMEKGLTGAEVILNQPVVVDGNIITGNGPAAATAFALTIVAQSCGEHVAREVGEGMLIYTAPKPFYF